jgi:hypothetical protein
MMTLKELKTFVNELPEEFQEFGVVNGEVGSVPNENGEDNGFVYRCDKPIVTLFVDKDSKEVCFLHQTKDEVIDIADEGYFDEKK